MKKSKMVVFGAIWLVIMIAILAPKSEKEISDTDDDVRVESGLRDYMKLSGYFDESNVLIDGVEIKIGATLSDVGQQYPDVAMDCILDGLHAVAKEVPSLAERVGGVTINLKSSDRTVTVNIPYIAVMSGNERQMWKTKVVPN